MDKNQPVAWMSPEGWAYGKHEDRPPECNIPLYTHPVKELTDEEITAISKEIFKDYKNFHYYQIDFARAILRKAQEK